MAVMVPTLIPNVKVKWIRIKEVSAGGGTQRVFFAIGTVAAETGWYYFDLTSDNAACWAQLLVQRLRSGLDVSFDDITGTEVDYETNDRHNPPSGPIADPTAYVNSRVERQHVECTNVRTNA